MRNRSYNRIFSGNQDIGLTVTTTANGRAVFIFMSSGINYATFKV